MRTSLSGTTCSIFIRNDSGITIIPQGVNILTSNANFFGTNTPWRHVALTYSNPNLNLYCDSVNTGNSSSSIGTLTLNRLGIAAWIRTAPTSHTQCQISEVGTWNAALTANEVASLANGMTCDKIRPQSLVFYAPLVRDLIDAKGGLTITNNNGATVATHPRVYA